MEQPSASARSYKALKQGLRNVFAKFVQEERASDGVDSADGGGGLLAMDPQMEYNREREHLERNVEALKKKISKDIGTFMSDHARLTREGVNLTEEMNLLKREAKQLKRQHRSMDLETQAILRGGHHQLQPQEQLAVPGVNPTVRSSPVNPAHLTADEAQRELEMQEGQLMALENRARELQMLLGTDGSD
mmetsp:Transcript_4650/g.8821  ORF Transcript_4650/g.8821 Transcript_4650/m.8821 type:complete len:190 (+) Transcript_4650:471-1040(+)